MNLEFRDNVEQAQCFIVNPLNNLGHSFDFFSKRFLLHFSWFYRQFHGTSYLIFFWRIISNFAADGVLSAISFNQFLTATELFLLNTTSSNKLAKSK